MADPNADRSFRYPRAIKELIREREIGVGDGSLHSVEVKVMDTKIFEKLLKYVTSSFASFRGQNVLKFASKNRAYYHIQSLFPAFIVKQMEAEIRNSMPTAAASSISVSMDQVCYSPFRFAQGIGGNISDRIDHPNLSVEVDKQHLSMLSQFIHAFHAGIGKDYCYCKGTILETVSDIHEKDWNGVTVPHSDFDTARSLHSDRQPFTLFMPLSEPANLIMSSVGCMAPKLSITKADVNVTCNSGDLILFAWHQYHRTGIPAIFNTTNKNGQPKKTKPNLRFHMMLSTDSVDITAESEETVSLHPSFTQMLSQCGSPEETKKPKVGKKPKVANTSKKPANSVTIRAQPSSEPTA